MPIIEMIPLGQDPGPFDVKSLCLTYNDILYFAGRYMGAIFELVQILTGNVFDVEGFAEAHPGWAR